MREQRKVEQAATTLLGLVFSLAGTVEQIVEQARQLVKSGHVALIGNYAGTTFEDDNASIR